MECKRCKTKWAVQLEEYQKANLSDDTKKHYTRKFPTCHEEQMKKLLK